MSPAAVCQAVLALRRRCGPSTSLWRGYHTLCPAGLERIKATPPLSGSSHPLLPRGGQTLSVDLGLATGGGLTINARRKIKEAFDHYEAAYKEYVPKYERYKSYHDGTEQRLQELGKVRVPVWRLCGQP